MRPIARKLEGDDPCGTCAFEPLEPGGKQRQLVKHSALLTFNPLHSHRPVPADLKLLFVRMPKRMMWAREMATRLAGNRAKHFALSEGFVRGALNGVSQAAAAAKALPFLPML